MSAPQGALTRYPAGSLQEAWQMVYPIMLTAASGRLMMFFDRLILAQYSTKAMTAAASAGMVVATFHYSVVSLVTIVEMFVGQYNGSKKYKKVSQSVWQMIWLSLAASLLFFPLAFFTGEFFVADPYDDLGVPYFKWLMIFGTPLALQAALGSFFVGIGKPKIVTVITVIANVINLVLDVIFVFGIEGWFPSLGTMGAAIATGIALCFQAGVLFYIFLSEPYKSKYGTWDLSFLPKLFNKEIKIGLPSAVTHLIEIAAWATQLHIMARAGDLYITVIAIAQTAFILFFFVNEGLSKGMGAIASNYMGAKRYEFVPKSLASMVRILVYFIGALSLVFVFYPEPLINGFIEGDYSAEFLEELVYYTRWALIWMWVYMFLDGIVWILSGILTASGDTKYIMYINCTTSWIFGVLPMYLLVEYADMNPAGVLFIMTIYGGLNVLLFYWRYRTGAWRENRIQS